MAMTKCWGCQKEISDTAAVCPHCGAAGTAGTMLTPLSAGPASMSATRAKKTGGSTWLLWIIGVTIGLLVVVLVIGANISPKKAAAQYEQKQRVYAACDQLMAESAFDQEAAR
jgi:hypothetical protein